MSEWKEISLSQLSQSKQIEIKTGPFGSQLHQSDYVYNGVPVVMPKDIIDWKIHESSIARTSKQMVEKLAVHILKQGDIVYGRRGDIGRHALISEKEENWLCGTGCIRIRLRKEAPFTPGFLSMFLRLPSTIESIYNQAVGATMPNLNTSIIENIKVIYPSRKEQEKITETLFTYDKLIENNNGRIAILEEMTRRLYREWFVQFHFPGHENVKMVESEFGMMPEGWHSGIVSDICDKIFSGGTPTTTIYEYWNGDLPWLSSGETRNSVIVTTEKTITEQGVFNSSTRKASKEDIVIASAGQGKTRGQTSFLLIDTYINQSVIALRGKPKYSEYLFINIKNRYDELRNASDSSSIRGSITTALMGSLKIIIPDIITLKMFSGIASKYIKKIGILTRKNIALMKTRDLLLPRLMSGDIDVSRIDIPVSEVSI